MYVADVPGLKLVSPLYCAVIKLKPTAREEVVKVAAPLEFSVAVPIDVLPSRKVTVPVGIPAVGLATVALKVTGWPATQGLNDEVSVTVVGMLLTTSVNAADVLEPKFVSPLYCAVIEWMPMASEDVVKVATPLELSATVPIDALPSRKVTAPVGVPLAVLVSVAVNVTDWPTTEGLSEEASVVRSSAGSPVPVSVTVCGLAWLVALSEIVKVPVRVPVAEGVNVTLMTQFAPAATLPPQSSVSAKSEAFVPRITRLEIVSGALLPLVLNVVPCVALGVPMV